MFFFCIYDVRALFLSMNNYDRNGFFSKPFLTTHLPRKTFFRWCNLTFSDPEGTPLGVPLFDRAVNIE